MIFIFIVVNLTTTMNYPAQLSKLHPDVFNSILNSVLIETVQYCKLHPVSLEFIFRPFPTNFKIGIDIHLDDDYMGEGVYDSYIRESYHQHKEIIQDWVSSLTWDSVIFTNIHTVTGIVNHVVIDDYKYTIKTDNMTLRQLTELVHRLNGSQVRETNKMDEHQQYCRYELYHLSPAISIAVADNFLIVDVNSHN